MLFHTGKRRNKSKCILPRNFCSLICGLWTKIRDEASHQANRTACKAVRSAVQQFIFRQELDLVDQQKQAALIHEQ